MHMIAMVLFFYKTEDVSLHIPCCGDLKRELLAP